MARGTRKLQQLVNEASGKVPASLRREAKLLAAKLKVTPAEALEYARLKLQEKLEKLKRGNPKTFEKVKQGMRPGRKPDVPEPAIGQSTWPQNPQKGSRAIVSGGLPSLGKRR